MEGRRWGRGLIHRPEGRGLEWGYKLLQELTGVSEARRDSVATGLNNDIGAVTGPKGSTGIPSPIPTKSGSKCKDTSQADSDYGLERQYTGNFRHSLKGFLTWAGQSGRLPGGDGF